MSAGLNAARYIDYSGLEIISAVGSAENPLSACVGINTGLVVAGNLGSANRLNYSVIGDAVNLVARLESLTRLYNVANIVSAASMSAAPGFVYRELDEVQVVSKNRSVSIYELVGAADTVTPVKQEELALFASALAAYRQQDWLRAREQFTQLLETCDNTALRRVFLQRIEHYEDNPPGPDWQGVYTFDKK
ncbi:MAG: adenylate/guanylate cyclase domain-containing protein [Pseudohongiellaceae bacterium]